ncbi:uncharacterized protein [Leptinotarsa decemlineata]|uniref:uncharacterized protein n=1 Tax=Leptinotarsa decemlineata TaxID=7539 RepID=UPI003D3087E1
MELQLHGLDTNDEPTEVKRRNLLLSKVGPEHFKILVDHFKPDEVTTKSFDDIVNVLNKYHGKTKYILSERVAFALRYRKDSETITQFMNILRGLAGNCEFSDSLKERLRDQLVIGINNMAWQQELIRLHPNNTATLEEIEATALILEQASLQSKQLSNLSGQFDVKHTNAVNSDFNRVSREFLERNDRSNKFKQDKYNNTLILNIEKDCLSCGKLRHRGRDSCPAKNKKCSACGALNHFSKVCITTGHARIQNQKKNTRHVHVAETKDGNESGGSYSSTNTTNVRNMYSTNKIMLMTKINGKEIEMLYDPGAAHSMCGKKLWKQIGSPSFKQTENLVAYTDM